jgi:ABC-type uncharacterized transport system ATPase subunit
MKTHDPAGGIVLARLSKSYGEVRAVQDVDLPIAVGETVALLGPNGAGKSTTIDMMLGLTRPDTGTVSLFGQPPEAAVQAGHVGGMLQTGSLLQYLNVRELLTTVALYRAQLPVGGNRQDRNPGPGRGRPGSGAARLALNAARRGLAVGGDRAVRRSEDQLSHEIS